MQFMTYRSRDHASLRQLVQFVLAVGECLGDRGHVLYGYSVCLVICNILWVSITRTHACEGTSIRVHVYFAFGCCFVCMHGSCVQCPQERRSSDGMPNRPAGGSSFKSQNLHTYVRVPASHRVRWLVQLI